eukprot:TRINITY_DN1389_c2_g1_i1.p1 TRINITY_DN1389_c2_g1~~TRINITY_DN1389_c2_g1_i1.p1  ORF type:complete len:113 (+),score=14.34 TRINITY_DN1389_c2_g1_i1:683-1021(+)
MNVFDGYSCCWWRLYNSCLWKCLFGTVNVDVVVGASAASRFVKIDVFGASHSWMLPSLSSSFTLLNDDVCLYMWCLTLTLLLFVVPPTWVMSGFVVVVICSHFIGLMAFYRY